MVLTRGLGPADADSFIELYDLESSQVETTANKETDLLSAIGTTEEVVLDATTTTDATAEIVQSTAEIFQQRP